MQETLGPFFTKNALDMLEKLGRSSVAINSYHPEETLTECQVKTCTSGSTGLAVICWVIGWAMSRWLTALAALEVLNVPVVVATGGGCSTPSLVMNKVNSSASSTVMGEYIQVIPAGLHVVNSEILLKLNVGVAVADWALATLEAR
jgi:hypothetical protein